MTGQFLFADGDNQASGDTISPGEYALALCRHAEALLLQAEATQEGQWMVDAIECYEDALEADPELLEPYLALAHLWLLHGEPVQARAFLDKAMDLSPFDPQVQSMWLELKQAPPVTAPDPESDSEGDTQ